MTRSKIAYQTFLNEIGIPQDDRKSNGGRINDRSLYGNWVKRKDPIMFEVGFRDWKSNY